MRGRGVALAAALLGVASPALAQDAPPESSRTAEQFIETAREAYSVEKPKPPPCPEATAAEIVVCREWYDGEDQRLPSPTERAIAAGEKPPDPIPDAPYVLGLPECGVEVTCHRVGKAPPPHHYRRPYNYRDDLDEGASLAPNADASRVDRRPSKSAAKDTGDSRGFRAERSEKRAAEAPATRPAPAPPSGAGRYMPPSDDYDDEVAVPEPQRPSRERLGLGTEFGEQRYSAASYTRFVRAGGRPVAIAELRYNDTAGLMALGIPVHPMPDSGEIMVRETADPFPGDRFARPAR